MRFALVDETDPAAPFLAGEMRAEATNAEGFASSCLLPGDKMRQYTLYFPLYNEVTGVQIGLKEGAAVQGGRAYRKGGPVLYYGSSITQADVHPDPTNCYRPYISQWTNTDYINLGFSGNGKAEPAMVEYLASPALPRLRLRLRPQRTRCGISGKNAPSAVRDIPRGAAADPHPVYDQAGF